MNQKKEEKAQECKNVYQKDHIQQILSVRSGHFKGGCVVLGKIRFSCVEQDLDERIGDSRGDVGNGSAIVGGDAKQCSGHRIIRYRCGLHNEERPIVLVSKQYTHCVTFFLIFSNCGRGKYLNYYTFNGIIRRNYNTKGNCWQ